MEFEWDENKRAANLVKHELDFADVERFDWTTVTIVPDRRFDYGEDRYFVYGTFEGVLHLVAITWRGRTIRVVSFRRANRKERRLYG